jgi:hypothetical protein
METNLCDGGQSACITLKEKEKICKATGTITGVLPKALLYLVLVSTFPSFQADKDKDNRLEPSVLYHRLSYEDNELGQVVLARRSLILYITVLRLFVSVSC